MEIRKATTDDGPALAQLLNQLGYPQIDAENIRNILKTILSEPQMGVLIAVENDSKTLMGLLTYSYKTQLRFLGLSMEIDELVVDEHYRGFGVGAALLQEAKSVAQVVGAKILVLSTNRDRSSYKRGFYLKQGFVEKNSALMIFKPAAAAAEEPHG